MANIKSFPNNQDEYIGAEHVMRWHHGRSSGVFGADKNASVAPVLDTMAVTVSDGIGWMSNGEGNGVVWWVDEEAQSGDKLQLAVDMADAVLPRIDRVVVSWQTTNYVALPDVIILKGVPASKPVAPALTNNNMVRQISLAAIRIPAGATSIDASMITDERLDETVCGIVTEKVGIDTSVMQAQFAAFWANNIADFEDYMERQKAAWEAFFGSVEEDTVYPVPSLDDAGKVVKVNENGDGYILGEAQTDIPVTSEPPADCDIWIDPNEESVDQDQLECVEYQLTESELMEYIKSTAYAMPNCTVKQVFLKRVYPVDGTSLTGALMTISKGLDNGNCDAIHVSIADEYGRIVHASGYIEGGNWVFDDRFSWVTPPMQNGVEYRTTERYNGRPVYIKSLYFGNMPNNATGSVETGVASAQAQYIDFGGTAVKDGAGSYAIPSISNDATYSINARVSYKHFLIETQADWSGFVAYVWVKYCKVTD